MQSVLGPMAGYRRRALRNLALVWPDMPPKRRRDIANRCLNNVGRTLIENYSGREFRARMAQVPLTGPGVAAFREAAARQQPVILVSGHYGNYEAVRAALVAQGHAVGGLYREMKNPFFNAHYARTLTDLGGPVFPKGRRGTGGFVRHLKQGGQLVLLFDQHVRHAPAVDFLGRPAHTATSAADLSLRYNAVLIPFYGIRKPDGLTFDAVLEDPIEPAGALEMTQQLSDSLARRVDADPAQWFWVHRRWRVRQRKTD
jgi:KDO2-lipid IV(A) lauroyltransferase